VGLDNGSNSSTFEDEVQACSDTDLTKQEIVNRRIPSMTLNPEAAARCHGARSYHRLAVRRGLRVGQAL